MAEFYTEAIPAYVNGVTIFFGVVALALGIVVVPAGGGDGEAAGGLCIAGMALLAMAAAGITPLIVGMLLAVLKEAITFGDDPVRPFLARLAAYAVCLVLAGGALFALLIGAAAALDALTIRLRSARYVTAVGGSALASIGASSMDEFAWVPLVAAGAFALLVVIYVYEDLTGDRVLPWHRD